MNSLASALHIQDGRLLQIYLNKKAEMEEDIKTLNAYINGLSADSWGNGYADSCQRDYDMLLDSYRKLLKGDNMNIVTEKDMVEALDAVIKEESYEFSDKERLALLLEAVLCLPKEIVEQVYTNIE